MGDNENIKEVIQENLVNNFINNKADVEKEMNLLNVLISTFCDNQYTYDEYCKKRMNFELEACDKSVTVDAEAKVELSDAERIIIQNKAMRKVMNNTKADFEEILKEEYVQHLTQKCYEIDQKLFYQISKYSSLNLLKHKIPDDVWENKRAYFEGICENKAKKYANDCANANKERHEQDIRTSMI
jgi:hypothetical protein